MLSGKDGDVLYAYNDSTGFPMVGCTENDMALISAAPELLEALQMLVEHSRTIGCNEHDYPAEHPVGIAYASIKKALGQ